MNEIALDLTVYKTKTLNGGSMSQDSNSCFYKH